MVKGGSLIRARGVLDKNGVFSAKGYRMGVIIHVLGVVFHVEHGGMHVWGCI